MLVSKRITIGDEYLKHLKKIAIDLGIDNNGKFNPDILGQCIEYTIDKNKAIKLFIGNKLDNQVNFTFNEVIEGYMKSEFNIDKQPTRIGLSLYIGSKDGLNGSFDQSEFEDLLEYYTRYKNIN